VAMTNGPVRGPFPVTRPRDIEDQGRPGAGECAVVQLGNQLQPLPKGEVPPSGIGWFRPKGKYWIVDLRELGTTLDVELESADKGLRFQGSVEVVWRVADPRLAAEQAPFDVPKILKRRIVPRLNSAARSYGLDAVGEFESWAAREQWTGHLGDGLLEVLEVACALRPDAEATGITRTGTLSSMQRTNAAAILNEGEMGLMADALSKDPEAAMEFYRDLREDKRVAMLAHLEIVKAVAGSDSSEEHERAHAVNELLTQIRNTLPSSATQLPPAASANVPHQLGEGRSRRRDRRARRQDDGGYEDRRDRGPGPDKGDDAGQPRHEDD